MTINESPNLRYLSEAYIRGKLSHAYIIEGSATSDREAFADNLAAALLCDRNRLYRESASGLGSDFLLKPCGTCPSCIKAFSGNHPDIIHVRHEKDSVLSVGEIREQLVSDMDIKPYYGPYKIYVVRDAQLMNENAQNALLKTIEEPAAYGLVLLLTDNADGFLQTIRSRCIRLTLRSLSREKKAEQLLDEEGCQVLDTAEGAAQLNAVRINQAAKEFEAMNRQQVLKILKLLFRDILVLKSTGDSRRLFFAARQEMVQRLAGLLTYEGINRILLAIDEGQARFKASVKAEAVFENLLLRIRREMRQNSSL